MFFRPGQRKDSSYQSHHLGVLGEEGKRAGQTEEKFTLH